MKRVYPLALIMVMLLTGCVFFKSDEQKMKDKINRFITSYNSGDVDAMTETLDSQSRQVINSTLNIADSLIGSFTGFNISIKDVFSLCFNFSGNFERLTIISFDDFQIKESSAVVYVSVVGSKSGAESSQSATFKMIKENGDWFIRDFSNVGGL